MTIRIGVSDCLLGKPLRYDGSHELNRTITEEISQWAELVGVCPEFELGLGVPRLPIRLEAASDGPHLMAPTIGADLTNPMAAYGAKKIPLLMILGLSGYIFKQGSPSCGLDVPVHGQGGTPSAMGMFAADLCKALPDLPVIEETSLADAEGQENFAARVRAYYQDHIQGEAVSP